jgi:hypothetical protein
VYEAELTLAPGADPRAPGGAVTRALCGHWHHEGPCRWPHNSEILTDAPRARFRTVFVCGDDEVDAVQAAIDGAVRSAEDWAMIASTRRDPVGDEVALGERLTRS